jgi:hypothetical protein
MVLVLIRLSALSDKADVIFMRMLNEPITIRERMLVLQAHAKHNRYIIRKPPMSEIGMTVNIPEGKTPADKEVLKLTNERMIVRMMSHRGLWPTDYNYEVSIE